MGDHQGDGQNGASGNSGGGGRIKIYHGTTYSNTASIQRSGYCWGTYVSQYLPATTVSTNPSGLEVIVDGSTYTAPVTFYWLPGTNHTISVNSPQYSGMNRYTWSSWSDGGGQTHSITSPSSDWTVTANFNCQYHLVFEAYTTTSGTDLSSSNYATLTLDGTPHSVWDGNPYDVWVACGSSHNYSFSSTSSSSGSTHRWYCSSPPSGMISAGDTIRAYYAEQWWLEVDENGHSSPCPGVEGWYNHGTSAQACVNDSIVTGVGGTRYVFSHWSGDATGTNNSASSSISMTAARTAVANWNSEYRVAFCAQTVVGAPLTSSNYATVTVDGSPHSVWDGNCYAFWAAEGTIHPYSYGFNSSASSSTHRWFCPVPPSGTISGADSIVADYREQWWLEVDENGYSSPCIGSEGWYDNGSIAYGCMNDSIIYDGETRHIFNTWTGDATGTNSSQSTAMTMNNTHTVVANWTTQHRLTLTYSGTPIAPTLTGAGWHNEGTTVPISTDEFVWDDGIRYDFVQWTGAPVTEPTNFSTDITMDAPYTANAEYTLAGAQFITRTNGGPDTVRVDGLWYNSPCTLFVSLGSSHEIFVDSIAMFDTDGRYRFIGWEDGISTVLRNITVNSGTTFTADFVTDYYITVDANGHGTPSGEGWYESGTEATVQIDSVADSTGQQRFVFDGWTGDQYTGTDNPATFTVTGGAIEQAQWLHQYHFQVFSEYDDPVPPVGECWLEAGTEQNGSVTSPDTINHMTCIGYMGTGPLSSGGGTSFNFTVTDSASVTWLWIEQLKLIVHNPVVGVETLYFDQGTEVIHSVPCTSYSGTDTRYICQGWTGSGSVPAEGDTCSTTFTIWEDSEIWWEYETEHTFTVNNPDGYDAPEPAVGTHWYSEGSYILAYVTSPDDSAYVLGWTGTGSLSDGYGDTASFVLDEPSSITWNWVTVSDTGEIVTLMVFSVYGYPVPSGVNYFPIGTELTCYVQDSVWGGGEWRYCRGWLGGGSVPDSGETSTVTFTIEEDSWIVWQWSGPITYPLTVNNPGGYDAPEPPEGTHYYSEGAEVTASVTSPDGWYFCTGWIGGGSVPDSGSGTSVSFAIMEPSEITWQWEYWTGAVCTLWVYSPFGSPTPTGMTVYPEGTIITATVEESVYVDDEWHYCTGWIGEGSVLPSGSSNSTSFTIDENTTITWIWDGIVRYSLEIYSEFDDPIPPNGIHWYEAGTYVTGNVTSPDDTMICTGFIGTGSAPDTSPATTFEFTIDEHSSVTWQWIHISDAVILTVTSPYGSPEPPVGEYYYPSGTVIHASVEDTIYETGTRHICTGWEGMGSVPVEGDTNQFTFTIETNSEINWQFLTQHRIGIGYTGCSGATPTQSGDGWYDEGSVATLTTDSVISYAGTLFVFDRWSGLSDADSFSHNLNFIVNEPESAVAVYGTGIIVTFMKNPRQDWGGFIIDGDTVIGVDSLTYYWARGSNHIIKATNPDYSGDTIRYSFTRWDDSPELTRTVGPLESDTTFIANYQLEYVCRVTKDPVADTFGMIIIGPELFEGAESGNAELWFIPGEIIRVQVSGCDMSADEMYKFDFLHWEDGSTGTIRFDTLDTPKQHLASYDGKVKIRVMKSPSGDHYGWIRIADSMFYYTSIAANWVSYDEPDTIEVSALDYISDGDTAYVFDYWSDGGARAHTVTCTEPTSFVAYYDFMVVNIAVCMENDTINFDTMSVTETKTTELDSAPVITNCGNFPLDYGLSVYDPSGAWFPAYLPDFDVFSLRARFEDMSTTMPIFQPVWDGVKNTRTWATDTYFGPFGNNIPASQQLRLWLQLVAPTMSSVYEDRQLLITILYFRPYMP
ncbi:hypothetical protein DRQ33_04310 [bacterium]|nr:MAG: hypothetical protein DRQ33_04310 [bacterium]